ncbi:pumilio, partial [Aphelenchoides avenae]
MYPSSAHFCDPPPYVSQFDAAPPPVVRYDHYASTSLHSYYTPSYYPTYYGWHPQVAMDSMPLSALPPPPDYTLSGFAPTMPDGVVVPRSETELEHMPTDKFKKLAKSRDGCAFLSRVLHTSEFARRAVFAQVCKHSLLVLLSKDPSGNYLVQDLMACYGDHLQAICDILKDEWSALAFHKYGTRVVQKAIEVFPPEEVSVIASKFRGRELSAMENDFSCHAVQKLIATGTPDQFLNFAEA